MEDIRKVIFILAFLFFAAGCAGQEERTQGILFQGSEDEAADSDLDGGVDASSDGSADGDMDGSAEAAGTGPAVPEGSRGEADSKKNAPEAVLYVQVAGAVQNPGVYTLPEGSRVFQAIELAGGLTQDADIRSVNQAQPLSDGEMIVVTAAGETAGQEAEPAADDGKVNLNTAAEAELMELPGIGAAKAASIVKWRDANGGFTQIEDLMKIEGIKEGVFSKIKDYVKVQ